MQKRIVPELFRNSIFYDYSKLSYLGFTKNINSILLYQDFEIKLNIKEIFNKFNININLINIIRNQENLVINIYYIKNLINLNLTNDRLFLKLNFYKFLTLKNILLYNKFNVHEIIKKKLPVIKKHNKEYQKTVKVSETYYLNKFFFYFVFKKWCFFNVFEKKINFKNKNKSIEIYDYLRMDSKYQLMKQTPENKLKFWENFNDLKTGIYSIDNIQWYNIVLNDKNYPFKNFKKYKNETDLLSFLPKYKLKQKQVIRFKPVLAHLTRLKVMQKDLFQRRRKLMYKTSKKKRLSKLYNFLKKFKIFKKKFKRLQPIFKEYFDYINFYKVKKLNNLNLIKPEYIDKKNSKLNRILLKFLKKNLKNLLKLKFLKKNSFKTKLTSKLFFLIFLIINFFNINIYLYYKNLLHYL